MALGTASALACHQMYFEIAHLPSTQVDPPIVERKSYWVSGLFPTVEVDARAKCPNGVAALREETSGVDFLIGLFTLTIYTPRTSEYFCRSQPWQPPLPPPPTTPAPVAPQP
jgi:Bor protein